MKTKASLDAIYAISQDVVHREIEGEMIIVPLTSAIPQQDDELFTLNATGRAIWERLDGTQPLREVALELGRIFEAPVATIQKDVLGLVEEFLKRKMVVPIPPPKISPTGARHCGKGPGKQRK